MRPLASTFDNNGKLIEVIIVSTPSSTGLCKVVIAGEDGSVLVRHKDRLTPLNNEARKLLDKS